MNVDIKELARKAGLVRIKDNQYANVTEEQLKKLLELYLEEFKRKLTGL
jgi:hypothetical protein